MLYITMHDVYLIMLFADYGVWTYFVWGIY